MLLAANKPNLKKHARTLLGVEHTPEAEKELIRVCQTGFERTYGHISHDQARHLELIDKILKTHGVEGTCENGLDFQYCNTGDTYAMTLLYYKGKLRIGDWGTIVEENS